MIEISEDTKNILDFLGDISGELACRDLTGLVLESAAICLESELLDEIIFKAASIHKIIQALSKHHIEDTTQLKTQLIDSIGKLISYLENLSQKSGVVFQGLYESNNINQDVLLRFCGDMRLLKEVQTTLKIESGEWRVESGE